VATDLEQSLLLRQWGDASRLREPVGCSPIAAGGEPTWVLQTLG
jgi:hypothetical protein